MTGLTDFNTFNTATSGYYKYNESGVTLPSDAVLNLDAGTYSLYHIVVCMSKDTGEDSHIGTDNLSRSFRAASVMDYYEPDYDYIYTIKFKDISAFPGDLLSGYYHHSKEVLVASESVTTATMSLSDNLNKIKSEYSIADTPSASTNFHIRWYITKKVMTGRMSVFLTRSTI